MIKIRTFLALIFVSFVLVLSVTLGSLMSVRSAEAIKKEIGSSLAETAHQMSDKLDNFMWSRSGEIKLLTELQPLKQAKDPQAIQNLIDQLQANFPAFSWIGFMNTEGDVLAGTGGILVGKNIAERPVFAEGIKGSFLGDVHEAVLLAKLLPNPSEEPLEFVDISFAVKNDGGETVGVLGAHLSWEWAKEVERSLLEAQGDQIQKFELFIVSKKDNAVLLGPGDWRGDTLALSGLGGEQAPQRSWMLERWPDGKNYLTGSAYGDGYLDYPGLGWTVLVRQPESVAYASAAEIQRDFVWIVAIAAVLFAGFGLATAEFISRPIRRLTLAADRIRHGGAAEIPDTKGFKDIRSLSHSLQTLLDSLLRTENELGHMQNVALHDQLTELPNRLALERYLEETIENFDPASEKLAFLYLDLDGFKKINDTMGHQVGDILLKKVAQRLRVAMLEANGIVVRLGGDEFLLISRTSRASAKESAERLASRVLKSIGNPFVVGIDQLSIGCSIGAAFYAEDHRNVTEVIRKADERLYLSKKRGKNRVTFTD
ncbi:diguanylate cyclase domain-containing protein [Saccharibacillus alkalitolerans]|uniref:Diguanylate cyclase n=1 Tax=Saccharibacillus alkalitolerans TaxID=2705290 RepID=A0ABX0F4J9_9BACL|nr:diguanylate cyclase [Saccharibacillus alkalitolerans]NGZ74805.1 diguanylate cyclase [Saccharibacillus alkalitolerans]